MFCAGTDVMALAHSLAVDSEPGNTVIPEWTQTRMSYLSGNGSHSGLVR